MKNKLLGILSFSLLLNVAFADESIPEKVEASAANAKRAVKKGAHRTQELFCADSDLECTARKAKNRVQEAGEATLDGAKEIKNKID